jgi:hypothetical protein
MADPFRRDSVFEAASDAHGGASRARTGNRRPRIVRHAVRVCADNAAGAGNAAAIRIPRGFDNAWRRAIGGNARCGESAAGANTEET